MLEGLFGNQNIERILLFLFVNEKGYGHQLQSLLKVPLTPIQKALARLSKAGILHSYFEGKIRMYQINHAHPFYWELESLLKKAYTLLPAQEKKRYCFIHKPRLNILDTVKREKNRKDQLLDFWKKLSSIQTLTLVTKSRQQKEAVMKIGKAAVEIVTKAPNVLIFQEKGVWLEGELAETCFSNIFRWMLDLPTSLITLEHLRYGTNRPVFLFHLTLTEPFTLEAVDAHLCADDVYLGKLTWDHKTLDFHWRIIGPNKNEEMAYHYT